MAARNYKRYVDGAHWMVALSRCLSCPLSPSVKNRPSAYKAQIMLDFPLFINKFDGFFSKLLNWFEVNQYRSLVLGDLARVSHSLHICTNLRCKLSIGEGRGVLTEATAKVSLWNKLFLYLKHIVSTQLFCLVTLVNPFLTPVWQIMIGTGAVNSSENNYLF